jgi:amino acid adenylation domain-containing protein
VSEYSSVVELVAAQCEAAAGIAVGGREHGLSYGALDERADRLAGQLVALGAGRERVVALVLPRSADLVVAALAALRTGAAYAPLDPAAPTDRLASMLEDARPVVVVTHPTLAARLPGGAWTVVHSDADAGRARALPVPHERFRPDDLAYVIYTSGSTGRPKGVELTHGGLLNLVRWHQERFALTPADRAPLMANPGFDASVWEMWPYLATGASLHVPDDSTRIDAEALRDWLIATGITVAFVATPLAERLLMLPWPAAAPLRALLTGADTLHYRPRPGLPFTLVNNYGPTECTVVATSGTVRPASAADDLPSIGWPIAGTCVHVLDERRRPVEAGVEGELYVGGAGVARGYRNQAALTAERFVIDASCPEGRRLYRTGDRVRARPDGSLAFLGRMDDQVKVRGHRIELDEIVAVLDSHPGVQASAVTIWPGPDGEPRLVGYLVSAPGEALTTAGLRATLRSRLPDYMLPTAFIPLEALPLTMSGKVDRARLPAPETTAALRDVELVAPRTAVEARLAVLVAELLGLASVGVTDNIFLLGGHSLLGTQLIVRIRDAFDVDLPLRTIFDRPSVEELAAEVEAALLPRLNIA